MASASSPATLFCGCRSKSSTILYLQFLEHLYTVLKLLSLQFNVFMFSPGNTFLFRALCFPPTPIEKCWELKILLPLPLTSALAWSLRAHAIYSQWLLKKKWHVSNAEDDSLMEIMLNVVRTQSF